MVSFVLRSFRLFYKSEKYEIYCFFEFYRGWFKIEYVFLDRGRVGEKTGVDLRCLREFLEGGIEVGVEVGRRIGVLWEERFFFLG